MDLADSNRHIEPPPTYEHVLVPLDGSASARRALAEGRYLATAIGATLHLFHAESHWDRRESGMHREVQDLARELGAKAEVRAEGVGDRRPAEVIDAFARELGNVAVVMASHGRSALAERIMGSTTHEIVRDSHRPIVVVGPSAPADPSPIERVVACLDGSRLSEEIVGIAAGWARDLAVPLWLYEVLEPDIERPDVVESDALIQTARRLSGEAIDVEWDTRHSRHPDRELVGVAREQLGSLLVVATRARDGAAGLLSPGVAHELIRHAPCPIVVQHPLGHADPVSSARNRSVSRG